MNQRICMPQVIKESISKSLSFVRSRDQAGNVKKLDGYRSSALNASPIVGLTKSRYIITGTRAWDLKISNRSLWIDGGETDA
jgi:hypothetical protein